MDRKTLDDTSKFLSYVLRHQPEAIGLTLDGEGWADIDALIAGAARDGRALDRMLLGAVVENNDKKRFALSADGQRIRAVQGHSHAAVAIAYAPRSRPQCSTTAPPAASSTPSASAAWSPAAATTSISPPAAPSPWKSAAATAARFCWKSTRATCTWPGTYSTRRRTASG